MVNCKAPQHSRTSAYQDGHAGLECLGHVADRHFGSAR